MKLAVLLLSTLVVLGTSHGAAVKKQEHRVQKREAGFLFFLAAQFFEGLDTESQNTIVGIVGKGISNVQMILQTNYCGFWH